MSNLQRHDYLQHNTQQHGTSKQHEHDQRILLAKLRTDAFVRMYRNKVEEERTKSHNKDNIQRLIRSKKKRKEKIKKQKKSNTEDKKFEKQTTSGESLFGGVMITCYK